jgi:hypothetical protein
MTALRIAAVFVALLSFVALAYWIGHRISSHRRQREQAALDRAVAEERRPRLSLIVDGPTDEILAVDPPVVRYAQGGPISTGLVWERDPDEVFVPARKPQLHRSCITAYADRRYSDICKTCRPVMGAHR